MSCQVTNGEVETGCFSASVENSAKPIHETRTQKGLKESKNTALLVSQPRK